MGQNFLTLKDPNVLLPTPSTDSSMLPPDQPMPASPRTCAFVKHLQGQIVHQATTGERGRTTTRVLQDLRNALADMFGLPPLPIPQPPPVTAYFDLSSYLYLSRLIHNTSLIIYELSVPPAHLQHVYIRTRARVNAYRTYPLSRYLAVNYLTSQRVFSHSTYLFHIHIPTLT